MESAEPAYCVALMARAPVPGRAKTRMIPGYGPYRSARFADRLLKETGAQLAGLQSMAMSLWCTPSSHHPSFLFLSRHHGYQRYVQPAGDLGAKMAIIMSRLLRQYRGVIIVGSDCPPINAAVVERCRSLLESGRDVVLASTIDGGYGLIGMRVYHSRVFRNMPWGTPRVMAVTRKRLELSGIEYAELPGFWDVDEPADIRRWRQWRSAQGKDQVV